MKVVIIGNGIGGFSAASHVRRLDNRSKVTIISAEKVPLYSACVLPDYIGARIPRERTFIRTKGDYEGLGMRLVLGQEVREIDPIEKKVITDDGKAFLFDKLVLATGSDAIMSGEPKAGEFKLKTLKDADEIVSHEGKKAVIVGSGAIGIEIAIALHAKGYKVTVLEMLDRLLPLGLDQPGADKVREFLEEHEIKVLLGERAKKVRGKGDLEGLVTDKRELECDTLIWAVGMRPRVELAKAADIELGETGGIQVNCRMQTNSPHIYACGDCVETKDILTGHPCLNLFWRNANRQGLVAAHNCVGIGRDYTGSENLLNLDVFGHHVVGFGHTETSLRESLEKSGRSHEQIVPSIIEHEKEGSYYRLVVQGDRCVGGQFINVKQDLGLVWSIMCQRRSLKTLMSAFNNEDMMHRKAWLHRLKPFFITKQH